MRSTRILALASVAIVSTLPVAGCGPSDGRSMAGDERSATPASAPVGTPKREAPREAQPTGPSTDVGDVPTNIPRAIPNPEPPADPAKIAVKAIATSATSNPLASIGQAGMARVSIHIDLTWSPVKQATQYQVTVNDDGSDKYVLKATVASKATKYRYGGGLVANSVAVDRPYKFMVRALNSAGNVIAQGTDDTKALYPLGIPKLLTPTNGQTGTTIQPQFQWAKVNNADGYYVEVFSGAYFVPTWRGYGAGVDRIAMTYGDAGDQYPGSFPAIWTLVLSPGARYTWSVTAFKTDTGNIATAKAYAQSNAPSQIFVP